MIKGVPCFTACRMLLGTGACLTYGKIVGKASATSQLEACWMAQQIVNFGRKNHGSHLTFVVQDCASSRVVISCRCIVCIVHFSGANNPHSACAISLACTKLNKSCLVCGVWSWQEGFCIVICCPAFSHQTSTSADYLCAQSPATNSPVVPPCWIRGQSPLLIFLGSSGSS